MVFLPRTDFNGQERCRTIVETEVLGFGYSIFGWRQVPVDTSVIGDKAIATRPEIEQIVIGNPKGAERRRFRARAVPDPPPDRAPRARRAHPRLLHLLDLVPLGDLQGPVPGRAALRVLSGPERRALRLRFAVFHQRYSTNTWPSWRLAQPFRMLAHNGEINTLRGNLNWMKSHETRMVAPAFGVHNEEIKPLVQAGSSDSAALDAVIEALVRAGRSLPLAKTLLIPPAWSNKMAIPESHQDLFSYCNCVMEPWDGPAGAGGDRRPLGDRRHGSQRPAADALCPHLRWPAWWSARRSAWCRSRRRGSSRRAGSVPAR